MLLPHIPAGVIHIPYTSSLSLCIPSLLLSYWCPDCLPCGYQAYISDLILTSQCLSTLPYKGGVFKHWISHNIFLSSSLAVCCCFDPFLYKGQAPPIREADSVFCYCYGLPYRGQAPPTSGRRPSSSVIVMIPHIRGRLCVFTQPLFCTATLVIS